MDEILWEETGPKARLKATVARYETAIRDAQAVLEVPLLKNETFTNNFYAVEARSKTAVKILRAALSDQPAEEPAESKLEAVKVIFENFEICGQMQATDENVMRVVLSIPEDSWMKLLAILDAQPSTTEEGAKETKR